MPWLISDTPGLVRANLMPWSCCPGPITPFQTLSQGLSLIKTQPGRLPFHSPFLSFTVLKFDKSRDGIMPVFKRNTKNVSFASVQWCHLWTLQIFKVFRSVPTCENWFFFICIRECADLWNGLAELAEAGPPGKPGLDWALCRLVKSCLVADFYKYSWVCRLVSQDGIAPLK